MLSYQHIYHAGNQADLHKHDVLARLIVALTQKPRPITYMETHAGRGLYDLSAPEAQKTGEAADGVLQANLPPGPYADAIAKIRGRYGEFSYPGSPLIAHSLLRETDKIHLMELHPGEHKLLRRAMRNTNAGIHKRDGYEGVFAISPPTPRKGLVLIDPSYEVKSEYETAANFVHKLIARWAEATVLIWYPILPEGRHQKLIAGVSSLNVEHDEVSFGMGKGMVGSGMIGINLPYGFNIKRTE